MGFPTQHLQLVIGHMFYASPPSLMEAIIFHNADTLDCMGAIGVARLLSIVEIAEWTPDLTSALKLIQRLCRDLPNMS